MTEPDTPIQPALTKWCAVPGYERTYEVSDDGRVRRSLAVDSLGRPRRLGELKQSVAMGYRFVSLSQDNRVKAQRVHRMVAAAFLGPCPEGYVVNHRDGNKENNCVGNLEYVTPQENEDHAAAHGLKASGIRHAMARLTEAQVVEMRSLYASGVKYLALGKRFGVHPDHALKIVKRRHWSHV